MIPLVRLRGPGHPGRAGRSGRTGWTFSAKGALMAEAGVGGQRLGFPPFKHGIVTGSRQTTVREHNRQPPS